MSRAFEQRLEDHWWPGLRARYPEPSADMAESLSAQEGHALKNIYDGLNLTVGDGNPKAVGFYRHTGFAEIPAEQLYPVTGLHVFVMDLRA